MDSLKAVEIVEGVVDSTTEEQLEAWQFLHDSGIGYQLQGWYGRALESLLNNGLING